VDPRVERSLLLAAVLHRDGSRCHDCGTPLTEQVAVLRDVPLPDDSAVSRPRVFCRGCAKARYLAA